MYIEKLEFEDYLLKEALLYDRILGLYAMQGSIVKAANLYEKCMKAGNFDNLFNMSNTDALMIQTMWRVHLLHPKTYQEDCERCYRTLLVPQYNADGPLLPNGLKDDITENCYSSMFCSMNLVDGMKRQLKFMSKISNHQCFRNAEYCTNGIRRYKLFLKLIGMRRCKAVPTMDIDLTWHTHMLLPDHYIRDTKELIGFTPNHDDDVSDRNLEPLSEKTEALWNATFRGVSYLSCSDGNKCEKPGCAGCESAGCRIACSICEASCDCDGEVVKSI